MKKGGNIVLDVEISILRATDPKSVILLNSFSPPPFQEGFMYCGMKYDMPYSLNNLGLFV